MKGHFGITPLMRAAANGDTETVQFLMEHGADRSFNNQSGMTALMYAALNGHIETIRALRQNPVPVEETKKNRENP